MRVTAIGIGINRISLSTGWYIGPVLALPLWGFLQLALDLPTDRWAAWVAAIRLPLLMAVAILARDFVTARRRAVFLSAVAWIGLAAAVTATVAHAFTPAEWWPFTSRNHFAQLLEIVFPVALWLGLTRRPEPYLWIAAAMLAAGIASTSRAGAALLIAEAIAVLCLTRRAARARNLVWFVALAAIFAIVADAGALFRRFTGDPLEYRREIASSTAAIIAARPWNGFGLGSSQSAYPAYAQFDAGRVVDHAHNDWLEFAAEGGVPYVALWIALAAVIARPAIRTVWGIGVCAVFLHALVDFPLARVDVEMALFIFVGAIERTRAGNALTTEEGS